MSIYTIPDVLLYKQAYKVSKADKLEYGEIYTPFTLIQQMLNLFEPSVFQDPSKTWLDVGAGQGYFSMLLFALLNTGLTEHMPDEMKRKTHIVQKMLYMVELKASNVATLREMFGPAANILASDYCAHDFSLHDNYDYIIGNPPYNAHGMKKVPTNTVREKKQDGVTLWTTFLRTSLPLLRPLTGQLCMIVPALWLKPDKSGIHQLLTHYKIEKLHCLSSNETNAIFKGEAQTPTCYFLLTNMKRENEHRIQLYDTQRQAYVAFPHTPGQALPLFGAQIIQKLQPWLAGGAGALTVLKTNMPTKKSQFTEQAYTQAFPYTNISTCLLEGRQPVLLLKYSDIPQPFHGVKKLVLAHKMYGFPYWDKEGHYGIANRDNYVILGKTDAQFSQLQAFLSTKFALYLFAAARYRMKYLEKYAFEFIPDITRLPGFPPTQEISDETVADFFGLDAVDKTHILGAHRKNYERFL
jgi:tRNA1(Val) A37 N6-methylase TrmN6